MDKVNFNGDLILTDTALFSPANRAFKYGDGLFETIRMFDGKIPFWSLHWKRLSEGAAYLQFENLLDSTFYKNEIEKLCSQAGNYRIRLNLFRKAGGLYSPDSFESEFLIEANRLEENHFVLNDTGLEVDLCPTVTIPRHPISNFKTLNCLPYVLAAIYKNKNPIDDCILLNDKNQVVEASSSNIFIIKNKQLLTPKLKSGCKDGTMRNVLIHLAPELGLVLKEKKIKLPDLHEATEVWLSNAILGIRWVRKFREAKYSNSYADQMVTLLNRKLK